MFFSLPFLSLGSHCHVGELSEVAEMKIIEERYGIEQEELQNQKVSVLSSDSIEVFRLQMKIIGIMMGA
jgi:hypothetical protein